MELLLILTAMFSALTGATGTRAPDVRLHQAAAVVTTAALATPARATATRPGVAMLSLRDSAAAPRVVAIPLIARIPLYAARRRE